MSNATTTQTVEFSEYSNQYDLLLHHNPHYNALLQHFWRELYSLTYSTEIISVLEIGGGTGNFSQLVLERFPEARITFIEPNAEMLAIAQGKLGNRVNYRNCLFEDFETEEFDLVISVHALYLMDFPMQQLLRMKQCVREGGNMLICDIGIPLKIWKWAYELFMWNTKVNGVLPTAKLFAQAGEFMSSNRAIAKYQQEKWTWRHDLATFRSYFADLEVLAAVSCYNGYSNFITARKNS